ncbi:hypothetical protein [uncultured Caulobacter sp.]|jgi:hypothetical protein|nr:hypothetical protein [uncultured Caulobacter sp.]
MRERKDLPIVAGIVLASLLSLAAISTACLAQPSILDALFHSQGN